MRDFFPAKETPQIRTTPPAWPHPGYSYAEMTEVEEGHREPQTVGDKFAWNLMRLCKWFMDRANGLEREQRTEQGNVNSIKAEKPLTESQWVRFPAVKDHRRAPSG